MDVHEIERRLSEVHPPAPRPELREIILDATEASLRPPVVDRFLARPWVWVLSLVLLGAFLGGGLLEERRHEHTYLDIVGDRPCSDPDPDAIRRFLEGGMPIAALTDEAGAR